ncbi:unnamed protein product [Closterium sp. NIES-64]|nr:unnamed protein product [Closterium sp. NIES-64]
MAVIRTRNGVTLWAVFASSAAASVATAMLLVACLLSGGSWANFAEAQPASPQPASPKMVVPTVAPAAKPGKDLPPLDPDWEAQMQSIIQQVANQKELSSFAQIFSNQFKTEQLYIDRNATILIPTNAGYWRFESRWDTLTRRQKRRLLRYHILKGRYTAGQLLNAAPGTLFPTLNTNLPVNKTFKATIVPFQSYLTRVVTTMTVLNAALTDNFVAHGVTMVLLPPNLNCTRSSCSDESMKLN